MMGCGVAPRGSLKLAHLAAKLTPIISGGPHMPVSYHSACCLCSIAHHLADGWQCMCAQQGCCCFLLMHTLAREDVYYNSGVANGCSAWQGVFCRGTAGNTAVTGGGLHCPANHHQVFAVITCKRLCLQPNGCHYMYVAVKRCLMGRACSFG